jgi:hypothetical protein
MSQIIKNLASGGPLPPAIPTSFTTNDGTATPAANVLRILGIDSTESDDDGILTRANPPSNLVDIVLTTRLFGVGSTVDAITFDVITFPLSALANTVYRFEFQVVGREAVSGEAVSYTVFAGAKTIAGLASIVETPYIDADQDAPALLAASVGFIASGNNVVLQVTGVLGTNITYKALGTYISV